MKKLILAIGLIFASFTPQDIMPVATPAIAQNINGDSGFDVLEAHMEMGDTAKVAVTGSKAVFTGPDRHTMLTQTDPRIKRGKRIKWTATVSGYGGGGIQFTAGNTMMGSVAGTNVLSPTLAGAATIADNFTTASGLTTAGSHTIGESGTDPGAFRFYCGSGAIANNDAIVYPGMWGRSHAHQFFGNTLSYRADRTTANLRATGGTTCGNVDSQGTPLNRSAYWAPALMDVVTGNYIKWDYINVYYKNFSNTYDPTFCTPIGGATPQCVGIPAGIKFLTGFNFNTLAGGPEEANGQMRWSCGTGAGDRTSLSDAVANCGAAGADGKKTLYFIIHLPNCWNGTHLDTPDHRSHVVRGSSERCPATHPYQFPTITLQFFTAIDASGLAGNWRLSSDSMVAGKAPGTTFHTDYMEAWSPTVLDTLEANCLELDYSCSGGDLGNSTKIKMAGSVAAQGLAGEGTDPSAVSFRAAAKYVSMGTTGMGKPMRGNGTFTGYVTASGDGEFGLMTHDGFVGSVDQLIVEPQ